MSQCWMIHGDHKAGPLRLRRTLAIGDALCATVVAQRLLELGWRVVMQSHGATHGVLRRVPCLSGVEEPGSTPHVNLDGAYENDGARRNRHFHEMFFGVAEAQLTSYGISLGPATNLNPTLHVPPHECKGWSLKFEKYPRPWIVVCPRSESYACRQVPDGVWQQAATQIQGTCFWIGRHPAPPGFVDLKVKLIEEVVWSLSVADLMISVDSGPLHIAVALGVSTVAVGQSSSPELHLSDQRDWEAVWPEGLGCLNCQRNICPTNRYNPPCQAISPEKIAQAANDRLSISGKTAAVVSVYRPDVPVLNRCLDSLIPQVDSIVVASDQAGHVPATALRHPKIRYVKSWRRDIGYGRKINFGARHAHAEFLIFVNDDVFLDPGAVGALRAELCQNVGLVAHLLRYLDGSIYHAGKSRSAGVRGWGHIDHRQFHPTIQEPCDMENVCGASVMVSRKALYDIRGFDEDFYLFAEDDDFALRMRRSGWRVIYTPRATGIHLEHQSIKKTGDVGGLVAKANAIFDRKWHAYFDHNLNRIPGNFNY